MKDYLNLVYNQFFNNVRLTFFFFFIHSGGVESSIRSTDIPTQKCLNTRSRIFAAWSIVRVNGLQQNSLGNFYQTIR